MSSWQQRMRDEKWEAIAHANDLEAKLKVALDRLSTISTGMHYTDECRDTWTQAIKLQHTAAEGLKIISKMKQREKP